MRFLGYLCAAFLAVTASAALAQSDDPETCRTGQDSETAIEACNRVINSGRYSGKTVNKAYLDRGQKYYQLKNYDRAVADASAAINSGLLLKADLAIAYSNRGNAYFAKNEVERAIAEYTNAIRVNPNYAAPYTARGLLRERKGERDAALSDFRMALRIPRGDFGDDDWAKSTAQDRIDELTKR
jgi:tetratricopeptide (TPR) repeat protein